VGDNSEERVGYGRPPKKSQFKKGQSGNPSGRPKKAPVLADLLERQLAKELSVNGPDGPVKLTVFEVMIAAAAKKAVSGDVRSTKILIETAERHGVGLKPVENEVDPADDRMLDDMVALITLAAAQTVQAND